VLKTCSGYPKDVGVTTYTMANPGNPLRFFDGWFLIQSGEADSTCCSVLQCVAVCCSVMQCDTELRSRLNVLQCIAVCCSVLQCDAV